MPVLVLDLVLLLFLLLIVIRGYVRGFFKTVFRAVRLILSVMIAYFLGKSVGGWIDNKFIHGWTYNSVYAKIHALYENASETFDVQKILSAFPKFFIPESIRNQMETSGETGEPLVASASEAISGTISHFISMILAYILVFILAWIALLIVSKVVGDVIHKIPIIGTTDHILGAVLGFLIAWIIMSLVCSLLRFFTSASDFYNNSHVLKFFAENPITRYISFLDFNKLLSKIIPSK